MKTVYVAMLVCLLLLEDVLSHTSVCMTSADCTPDECCLTRNGPIGRRRRSAAGYCGPLGHLGSKCIFRPFSNPPTYQQYVCPCGIGLRCRSIHMTEVPIGEMGTCVF